jgi:tRNA (pseudouridine54-N1)-methyltransferase
MRRFVILGQRATASADFSLDDLPGTSGRLDILVRCLRAAVLVSHGVRRDAVAYLVLLGGPTPRTLRVDGGAAQFLRPDERSLATLVRKVLATASGGPSFVGAKPGIAVADGGLEVVLGDLGRGPLYVLEEGARDLREAEVDVRDPVFFVGDHLGFDDAARARLSSLGAVPIRVGPVAVHAEDAIAVVWNEIDRQSLPRIDRRPDV